MNLTRKHGRIVVNEILRVKFIVERTIFLFCLSTRNRKEMVDNYMVDGVRNRYREKTTRTRPESNSFSSEFWKTFITIVKTVSVV